MATTGKAPGKTLAGQDGSGVATLELERFLPYRLSLLSNRISQTIADLYADRFGIGVTEWRVIAVLGRYAGLSANEVAERTAMDKVAVSRAVARLLERGLIERDTHGDDRRRSVLALSGEGLAVHAQVAPLALDIEQRLLAGLDAEERGQLQRLLDKLGDGIGRLESSGG
ncbi:MarR family transcriptional regulator [Lysobacter oculi]|uniref:MarR family transcriptional regulator n=1 Tax=Solilutibacter oculi TaxID=2698682 RepID=A0A344J6U1_9GAMM|nr:MarR family winged helix-turn-helix transcriptional regulator [Lysobacter oculi]AXA84751.1 MarR family transcriptional regulator [Lysobacter oculi]